MPIYVAKSGGRRRKKDAVSKKQIDRWHCAKRVAERLGIPYTDQMRKAIIGAIREGKGTLVEKSSNTRTIWEGVVPGYPSVMVVYSNSTREIVTMIWRKKKKETSDVSP